MKTLTMILFLTAGAFAQAENNAMPVGIFAGGAYNQLGTPQLTGVVSAIYSVKDNLGLYATTTAEIYPAKRTDPTTKRDFYAIQTSIRQGVHKQIWQGGSARLLVGGDLGAGFSQASPSGINVSLAGSFTATPIYQIRKSRFSVACPVRMLYVSGAGFNPVVEPGLILRIGN